MTDLIEQLSAFEGYSARCEVATKQDAALHGYLHQMTACALADGSGTGKARRGRGHPRR